MLKRITALLSLPFETFKASIKKRFSKDSSIEGRSMLSSEIEGKWIPDSGWFI
jgi:hypothetical protein